MFIRSSRLNFFSVLGGTSLCSVWANDWPARTASPIIMQAKLDDQLRQELCGSRQRPRQARWGAIWIFIGVLLGEVMEKLDGFAASLFPSRGKGGPNSKRRKRSIMALTFLLRPRVAGHRRQRGFFSLLVTVQNACFMGRAGGRCHLPRRLVPAHEIHVPQLLLPEERFERSSLCQGRCKPT